MRLWTSRRKPGDDEKPGHGSDRRGSYRIPSARLHVKTLPEGVSMPTLPTDILGGLLPVVGFIASVLPDEKK
jgi:hypothetical protein